MGDNNKCLARADIDFGNNGANVMVMNCVDASILNDGREIFILTTDKEIQSHGDETCLYAAGDEIKLVMCIPLVTKCHILY